MNETNFARKIIDRKAQWVAIVIGLVLSGAANAQVAALTTKMTAIQTVVIGLGAAICGIAFAFAGYKLAFDGAKFRDVSNVFIGGAIVGLAAALGTWIVT